MFLLVEYYYENNNIYNKLSLNFNDIEKCYIYIMNKYPQKKMYSTKTIGDPYEIIKFTNDKNIIFCILDKK
jgi:hypothetical protein